MKPFLALLFPMLLAICACTALETPLETHLDEQGQSAPSEPEHYLEVDGQRFYLDRGASAINTDLSGGAIEYSSFTGPGHLSVNVHHSQVNTIEGVIPVISNNSYRNGAQMGSAYIEFSFDSSNHVMLFSEYGGTVTIRKEGDQRIVEFDNLQCARYTGRYEDGTAFINGSVSAVVPHNPY